VEEAVNEYAVLVDLGKKRDRTVFMAMKYNANIQPGHERVGIPDRLQHTVEIPFIDQFLGISYPQVVENLVSLMGAKDLSNNTDLLVDGRSVGEAVIDMMRRAYLTPIPIVATGGDQVHEVHAEFGRVFQQAAKDGRLAGPLVLSQINVPKEDLVAAGMAVMQQNRLRVAKGLRWAEEFHRQLSHFKGSTNERTKRRSFEADEVEVHDDMVFCYLMGAWWFTRTRKDDILDSRPLTGSGQRTEWDPMDYI
jgi:hypothetical protein